MAILYAGCWIIIAWPLIVLCQSSTAQRGPREKAKDKPLEFAVVSIRRNKAGGPQQFGAATPDGYSMRNMFLAAPIVTAYVPQTGGAKFYADSQIVGLANWLTSDSDHYDIDAKVDDADIPNWQNPALQPSMLRIMLQSMLADRLKLAVHRETKIRPVFSLVKGRGGPKFKETDPNDTHAGSYPFPGGGRVSMEVRNGEMTIHYFGISMAQLASLWSDQEGRPVQDSTGLTGKYDITIRKPAHTVEPSAGPQESSTSESDPSIFSLAEELGLKLEPSKEQIETLVIDHVERPSDN